MKNRIQQISILVLQPLMVLLFLTVFINSNKASARQCNQLFMEKTSVELILDIESFESTFGQRLRQAQLSSQRVENKTELLRELVTNYNQSLRQVLTPEHLIRVFKSLKKILNDPEVISLFDSMDMNGRIRPVMAEMFKNNYSVLIRQVGKRMTEAQKKEAVDTLLDIVWLRPLSRNNSAGRDSLWRLVWVTRLSLQPEIALRDLHSHFSRAMDRIEDGRARKPSIVELTEYRPDIIETLLALPKELLEGYRRLFMNDFYLKSKDVSGLRFLQKLNHGLLRDMVKNLEARLSQGQLSQNQLIEVVDTYWQKSVLGTAATKTGSISRGGYSFAKVLDLALAQQVFLGRTYRLGRQHTLYLFGSFPNGMARYGVDGSGKKQMESDIDITFERYQAFHNANVRSADWVRVGDAKSFYYRMVQRMERQMLESLEVEGLPEGQLISAMTNIAPRQLLKMKATEPGKAYPTLINPMVIEISSNQIVLHIHLLKKGAKEPETVSFEVANE